MNKHIKVILRHPILFIKAWPAFHRQEKDKPIYWIQYIFWLAMLLLVVKIYRAIF